MDVSISADVIVNWRLILVPVCNVVARMPGSYLSVAQRNDDATSPSGVVRCPRMGARTQAFEV